MGGGRRRTTPATLQHPDRFPLPPPRPLSATPTPLFRHSCAGRNPPAPHTTPTPIHPSPLPGEEVRRGWNAASPHSQPPTPQTVAPRTPPLPPTPATLTPEQECRTMPPSPQQRQQALPAGNLSLANGDQNLTKVDTRLTRVDKTCHCQPLRHSRAPHQHTPNKPEQIRTNLNAAKYPDQIGNPPESPPNTPKKRNLNTVAAHSQPPTPHLTSPLKGGRDELGKGRVLG